MANTTIAIKKSATVSSVPSSLEFGELAINYADGKLYYKNVNSSIVEFSPTSGGTNSFGTVNANSTLVIADSPGSILTLIAGDNISIVGDAINDKVTFSANIAPAFDKANSTTYNSNVVISVADNTNAALRITQTGTGHALLVEDTTNPDSTPFVVDAGGRVGVGTSAPTLQFQVTTLSDTDNRSIGVTEVSYLTNFRAAYMTYWGASATGTTYGISNANLGTLRFQNTSAGLIGINGDNPLIFATLSLERARITGAGNFGIGTSTPAEKLHIQSGGSPRMLTIQSTDVDSSAGIGLTNDAREWAISVRADLTDSLAFRDITTNEDRLTITSGGDVGIATSAPGYKLDVNGTVNAASVLVNGSPVALALVANLAFNKANTAEIIAIAAFDKVNVSVSSATSTATLSWNSDTYDQYQLTAMAADLTISADSGTPVNGQKIIFRFKDNGTARTISFTTGSSKSFRAIGLTLPTTTVISKTLYVGAIYNSADDRWDVIATAQEA